MNTHNHVLEALNTIIDWDLPDISLVTALNDRAGLIAGENPEDTWTDVPDAP